MSETLRQGPVHPLTAADWEGQEYRPVTRRRMREAAEANPGRRIVMRCACGTTSGTAGDYWQVFDDTPMGECVQCGETFELGYTRSEWVPV
jgi:hypothetical protein